MFSKSTTNLEKDFDAIKQDVVLLLASNKGGLYGDPWYGTNVKQVLWDPNHRDILTDIIRDHIFESINTYMPNNITINREDITVNIVDNYANVQINLSAYTNKRNDMLNISLLNESNTNT